MTVKNPNDNNNSLELIKCKGCSKNIKLKNCKDTCFIYINNEISRKINIRKVNEYVKPYESYDNLVHKNSLLEDIVDETDVDIAINERIEAIDQYIDADKEILDIIKNNILIKETMDGNNDIITKVDLKLVGAKIKFKQDCRNERKFIIEFSIYRQNELDVNLKSIVIIMDY